MSIAVFTNGFGQIVILEQADGALHHEDHHIIIARENALATAKAILAEAGLEIVELRRASSAETSSPTGIPDQHTSGLSPGAERQRRYRERHRNGAVTAGVTATERDSHGDLLGADVQAS